MSGLAGVHVMLTGAQQEWIAQQMGLIPLLWLGGLRIAGQRPHAGLWWMATAFAMSWVADAVADHWPSTAWSVTLIYPVAQTSLIAAAISLSRRWRVLVAILLTITAISATVIEGTQGPDLLLCSVAWLGIAAMVWNLRQIPVRNALLVYFGFGWATWMIHLKWLIAPTWYPFQLSRAVGLCWFCWAVSRSRPLLRAVA